jgi:hypothetical protein
MVGVPFAASRVFDELASLALDPAPGTRAQRCSQNGLDNADAVIDGAEFVNGERFVKIAPQLEDTGGVRQSSPVTRRSVNVHIEQLVLHGFASGDRKALVEGLQSELSRVLADRATRAEWARPHRTPVLRLGRMPLEPGPSGGRKFGREVARAIGRGLNP